MKPGRLQITQLPARNLALLQVTGTDEEALSCLVDRLLSEGEQKTPAHACPRAYEISATECLLVDFPRHHIRRSLRDCGRVLLRLTDVSSAFALVRVAGTAMGSLLEMELEALRGALGGRGSAARTGLPCRCGLTTQCGHSPQCGLLRLGEAQVLAQCTGGDSFDLYVVRGLSTYLESWLRARWVAHFPAVGSTPQ